ncbi:hypothetical protein AVEN_219077-1 [Araneus ventricosus]|uniref:Uncharacterized protein n=1 Tax=Araneus ventricosus TaxID=182803 RepID=A0A4Y2GCH6_ARAVE|nr:hypothetical protein AVEN_219077-1 [Araneus ventricosus]
MTDDSEPRWLMTSEWGAYGKTTCGSWSPTLILMGFLMGTIIIHRALKEFFTRLWSAQYSTYRGEAEIQMIFRNRKVILERHVPLYGSGALFSHIGGLLAYWLGISVLSSLDIIEKFFGIAVICWKRYRKNKV